MPARSAMTHRATIQRDMQSSTDEYNQPGRPQWEDHLVAHPCRAWFRSGREIQDGQKIASVNELSVIVPKGTDVTPGDRLDEVADRRGNVIFQGPVRIESIGQRRDHIALTLQVV